MDYANWRAGEVERLYEECRIALPRYIELEWMRQDILLSPNPNLFPSIEIFIEAQREVLNISVWYRHNIDICNLKQVTREYQILLADEVMSRI